MTVYEINVLGKWRKVSLDKWQNYEGEKRKNTPYLYKPRRKKERKNGI